MQGTKTELRLPVLTLTTSLLNAIYDYERRRIPDPIKNERNQQSDKISRHILEMINDARTSDSVALQLVALKVVQSLIEKEMKFDTLLHTILPIAAHKTLMHTSSYLHEQMKAVFKRAAEEKIHFQAFARTMPTTPTGVTAALNKRMGQLEAMAARKKRQQAKKPTASICTSTTFLAVAAAGIVAGAGAWIMCDATELSEVMIG